MGGVETAGLSFAVAAPGDDGPRVWDRPVGCFGVGPAGRFEERLAGGWAVSSSILSPAHAGTFVGDAAISVGAAFARSVVLTSTGGAD